MLSQRLGIAPSQPEAALDDLSLARLQLTHQSLRLGFQVELFAFCAGNVGGLK